MNKILMSSLAALLLFAACSSLNTNVASLTSAPTCKAWKEAPLGSKNIVDVDGERAVWKHSCGITGCSEVSAYYKGANEIYTANSGLIKMETSVAKFDGKKFTVESSVVKVAPFEFKDGKANYVLETMGTKNPMQVNYNSKCSARQAALATAILLSK